MNGFGGKVNITGDPDTAGNGALNYTLDPVGNRSSLTSTLTALPSQSFTYDFNDRPIVDTFDDNGNTVTSGGHAFLYDYEDHLTQFDATLGMQYDGDGNRVSRIENGTEVRYLVDEMNPTGWPQVAEELVGGSVVAQYTHGLMRISQNRDSGSGFVTSYYGYDAGGSARQLFDAAGSETDTYIYDAFGNVISQTGSTENVYLYRGEQFDPSLGMYYLRARYYIPTTGRFLTMDKYGSLCADCESPGTSLVHPIGTRHVFEYSESDPVNYTDPSGLEAILVRSLKWPEVKLAGSLGEAFGCGVSIGLLTSKVIFLNILGSEDLNWWGATDTLLGCYLGVRAPGSLVSDFEIFYSGAGVCASSIGDWANTLNAYMDDPTDPHYWDLILSSYETAFGCAYTMASAP